MTTISTTAHAVRVRFAGPTYTKGARWVATWEGWPDASRPVRRVIPFDHAGGVAHFEAVAQAYVEWLNRGPADYPGDRDRVFGHHVLKSVHVGQMGPDEYALLIDTDDARDEGEHAAARQ